MNDRLKDPWRGRRSDRVGPRGRPSFARAAFALRSVVAGSAWCIAETAAVAATVTAAMAIAMPLPVGAADPVRLAPGMPALAELGVPFLHEVIPEHRLSDGQLAIEPLAGPYEWIATGPAAPPFALRVAVDGARFDRAVLTVWDWHNHPVAQRRFEGGKEEHAEFSIAGLGSYLLTLDAFRDGTCRTRMIRNLAATEDLGAVRATWRIDEFFTGLCAFPGRYHWKPGGEATLPAGLTEEQGREREAAAIARLGMQVVRIDESVEMGRRKGPSGEERYHFDFSRMDAAAASYTSRGFQLALQTMNAADWAVLPSYADQGRNRWRYPHREKPQRAYLAALAKRYGKDARFIQISNEPDQIGYWSGTNEEFVEQFRFSVDELRRVAPDLPLTNGGYSLVDEAKCAYFIDRLHPLVDLPAYNAHGNLADLKRSFATMRRLQAEAGDEATGWINTETGYSAWRLEQERRQAQIDTQKVLYSWANGHRGVLLFCSRMTRPPGRDGSPDFGLLDHQYCPRFVYASLAALHSALAAASFERTLVESESVHLYLFRRGKERILAGFTLAEAGSALRIVSDASSAAAIDEMGNVGAVAGGTSLELVLDAYPRYWILEDATRVDLSGEVDPPGAGR